MARLLVNKHTASTDKAVIKELFDKKKDIRDDQGEIIIMNNPAEPGIAILDASGNVVKVGEGTKGGFNCYDNSLEFVKGGMQRDLKIKEDGYRVNISEPQGMQYTNALKLDESTGKTGGLYVPISNESGNSIQITQKGLYVSPIPESVENLGERLNKIDQKDLKQDERLDALERETPGLSELENIVSEHTESITQLQTATSGLTKLENTVTGHTESISQLQSATSGLDELENAVAGHTESISQLQSATSGLADLENAVTGNTENISQLQSATSGLTDLTNTVTGHTESISQLQSATSGLSDLTNTVTGHTESISQLQSAISGLPELENTVTELSTTVSSHTDSISGLAEDVNTASEGVKAIDSRVNTLNSKVSALYADVDKKVRSVSVISTEPKYIDIVNVEEEAGKKDTDPKFNVTPKVIDIITAQEYKPEVPPKEEGGEPTPEVPEVNGLVSALDAKKHIDAINSYSVNGKLIKENPILGGSNIKVDNISVDIDTGVSEKDNLNVAFGKQQATLNTLSTCFAAAMNNIHQDLYLDKLVELGPKGLFPGVLYNLGEISTAFPEMAFNTVEVPNNTISKFKALFDVKMEGLKPNTIPEIKWEKGTEETLVNGDTYLMEVLVRKDASGTTTKLGKLTSWTLA